MSLQNRWMGCEFSVIERELLFKKENENKGYVRFLRRDGLAFALDPSPFYHREKNDVIYVSPKCIPPEEGDLVSVTVTDVEEEIKSINKHENKFFKILYKTISSWNRLDPKILMKKKRLLEDWEIIQYFQTPYNGLEEEVTQIGTCSALYAFSSPPDFGKSGGVNAGVFASVKPWTSFSRSMRVIPDEFKRVNSEYYYKISKTEDFSRISSNKEVNLAYLRPEKTPLHIPITIDCQVQKIYADRMSVVEPLITASVLDGLLIHPVIPDSLSKDVRESVYSLSEDILETGFRPGQFDLGSCIQRLSRSLARLHCSNDVKKEDIHKCVEIWADMLFKTKKIIASPLLSSNFFQLSGEDRRVYRHLVECFPVDTPVAVAEVEKSLHNTRISLDQYNESVDRLNLYGLVIRRSSNMLEILDNSNVKEL